MKSINKQILLHNAKICLRLIQVTLRNGSLLSGKQRFDIFVQPSRFAIGISQFGNHQLFSRSLIYAPLIVHYHYATSFLHFSLLGSIALCLLLGACISEGCTRIRSRYSVAADQWSIWWRYSMFCNKRYYCFCRNIWRGSLPLY